MPNYLDHLTCAANEKSDTEISRQEFSTDSNVAEKKLTTLVGSIIIISLGFLGFVLIFITIGFCFRIFSEYIIMHLVIPIRNNFLKPFLYVIGK